MTKRFDELANVGEFLKLIDQIDQRFARAGAQRHGCELEASVEFVRCCSRVNRRAGLASMTAQVITSPEFSREFKGKFQKSVSWVRILFLRHLDLFSLSLVFFLPRMQHFRANSALFAGEPNRRIGRE
jgi:hypothetical protein